MQNLSCHKKIALDLDGTLVTCKQRQMSCLFYLLNRFYLAQGVDLDLVWQLKSAGRSTKQTLLFLGVEEFWASKIAIEWGKIIETPYWLQLDGVHDFVFDFLRSLRDRKIILLTARKNSHWLHHELRRLRISRYFDEVCVVSPENAVEGKTNQLARCKADVFVGDTVSDAMAARKANVEFLGVTWGQHDEGALVDNGCSRVINDPLELKTFFGIRSI